MSAPTAAAGPTFTIRPRDDLGAMDESLTREHLPLAELDAWFDLHTILEGTYEIIDDRDRLPACGYEIGTAGGAQDCECGRPTCGPQHRQIVAGQGGPAQGEAIPTQASALPEGELSDALKQAARDVDEGNPALGLLLTFLSECPPEVAAGLRDPLRELVPRLHPDSADREAVRRVLPLLVGWT